jgi:hypothetical protein
MRESIFAFESLPRALRCTLLPRYPMYPLFSNVAAKAAPLGVCLFSLLVKGDASHPSGHDMKTIQRL